MSYGYQGSFSEEVSEFELNYNEFGLRTYDPQIGRWTTPDPYDEFPSPYTGMGNDPANNVDPSGGNIFSAIWSFLGGSGSAASGALAQVACPGATAAVNATASGVTTAIRIATVSLAVGGSAINHVMVDAINANLGAVGGTGMGGSTSAGAGSGTASGPNGDGYSDPAGEINGQLNNDLLLDEAPDEEPINKPFNYIVKTKSYRIEQRTFLESSRSWTGLKSASAISIGLAADDATGVGVIDDVAIPFIFAGALVHDLLQGAKTREIVRPIVVPIVKIRKVAAPLMYVTYTKYNYITGQVYVGRTSGYGDPLSLVALRDMRHHKTSSEGWGPAFLDRAMPATKPYGLRQGDPSYQAIRGREQLYIDHLGGIGSRRCGNAINGISPINRRREIYLMMGRTLGGFWF